MKKILLSASILVFLCSMAMAGGVEGTWNATIETEYGPWEFSVEYKVDGKKISGEFITEMGNMEFGPGEIKGKKFEYTFEIEYVTYTHKGELVGKDEILIKSISDGGEETEFTMTRAK